MAADESRDREIEELRRRLKDAEPRAESLKEGQERARRELSELESLYRDAPVGLCVIGADYRYVRVNERLAEINGVPAEAHIGRTIREIVPDLAEQGEALVRRVIDGDEPVHDVEVTGATPAQPGRTRTWVEQLAPVRDGQGQVIAVSVVAEEVTERKQVEEERARLLEKTERLLQNAEAASRAKDEFLAMLGHELRNPLAAIASAVQLLDRIGKQEDSAASARGVIARQTAHLTRLVNDLLDVARVASGKIVLDRRPVDLAALVKRAGATFAVAGSADRHLLTVDAHSAWIDADSYRIDQVIGNLVTNALRYTPAGGRIRLTVRPDGHEAVLRVADTGIGIAVDLLPRIFDRFVQGDSGLKRSHGGLGIGLTIVHRLVAMHGGTIIVESHGPGTGSVFTVRFPRITAPFVQPEPETGWPRMTPARRVLLVDDNQDIRDMMRYLLELEGHTVFEAADGPAALEAAAHGRPDVALIDISLPGFDGYELAQRLRATPHGRRLPLVALTGYGRPEDRARARAAGFALYLVKPVDPTALANAVAVVGVPASDDERLAAAAALMRLIASNGDLGKTCDAIAEAVVNLLRARAARVWLNDATSGTLTACGSFGVDPEITMELLEVTVLAHGSGMPGDVARSRAPLYIADASRDPRWVNRRFIRQIGIRGYAGLPLITGEHVEGVLSVMFSEAREFSEEEKVVLELLADQAGIAIQNARMLKNTTSGSEGQT